MACFWLEPANSLFFSYFAYGYLERKKEFYAFQITKQYGINS